MPSEARQKKIRKKLDRAPEMVNFGASKLGVRGGARAPGAPPLDPLVMFKEWKISSCVPFAKH